jgi:hypothetical protein
MSNYKCSYVALFSEYGDLIQLYEEEQEHARRCHHLRCFPDISQWQPKNLPPLTESQKKLVLGPSHNAVHVKRLSNRDSNGRQIIFRTVENDYCSSHCSYVSSLINDILKVGQILTIFHHTFNSCTTTFVYISWFQDLFCDGDSNLSYVYTGTHTLSIVPVSTLSHPLVTAFDEEEPEKLWILNL